MPVSARKNAFYAAALPLFGRRCHWRHAEALGGGNAETLAVVERVLLRHRVVGGCVQSLRGGQPAETYTAGWAALRPRQPVQPDTVFRTASVAKAVCALLVMRLQTLGKLGVEEDISAFWGSKIRNPQYPGVPIPLGSLLSHTSGLIDTPRYFRSFQEEITADMLLSDGHSFSQHLPYRHFRYSNFGAGLVGSLLEQRFNVGIEELMQRELFRPLGVQATFDIRKADVNKIADCYRVLPPDWKPAFDAKRRFQSSAPVGAPNPQRHFLLASGNLYIAAGEMARLCCAMIHGQHGGEEFLSGVSLQNLRAAECGDAEQKPMLRHGMGLLAVEDDSVLPRRVYGHQGFAYGAANGFFFDERGNGFVSFNSGASEQRVGRLSCLNLDLICAILGGEQR